MGYGERSLNELSRKLTPGDVPVLVSLLPERELSVGVQFALASQCEHTISAVREAVAGLSVSVVNVPYNAMTNRHDYPNSPAGTYKALAVIH